MNRREIFSNDLLKSITSNIRQPIEGSDERKNEIKLQCEGSCMILYSLFYDGQDNEGRWQSINAGVVDALLRMFETRDLALITHANSEAFLKLTLTNTDNLALILRANPYPGLLKLLKHKDIKVISDSITSIFNILNIKSNSSSITQTHPQFDQISECGGIEKIFSVLQLQSKEMKQNRNKAALCLGLIFQAKEISNPNMKMIITHIKSLINDSDVWTKNTAKK
ncbi:MAG: hypothetical protein EZS28_049323, partial [Streblomastix strix]